MRQVPADSARRFCLIDPFPMCFNAHGECTRWQQIGTATRYPHCIAAVVPTAVVRQKLQVIAVSKIQINGCWYGHD